MQIRKLRYGSIDAELDSDGKTPSLADMVVHVKAARSAAEIPTPEVLPSTTTYLTNIAVMSLSLLVLVWNEISYIHSTSNQIGWLSSARGDWTILGSSATPEY